jgi:heme/copper-type cytochrome/quinol oxidase subunit 2
VTSLAVLAAMVQATDTVSSIFAPVSTPAIKERDLSMLVLALSAIVFVVVGGLIAYNLAHFRAPAGDQGTEPPQVYGSAQVEAAWTVIPLVIIVVLMLATARGRSDDRRTAMVVGDPLPQARHRHCQRAPRPGQRFLGSPTHVAHPRVRRRLP